MDMVEKVSRAIAAEMGEPLHGNSPGFRRLARAAIAALRDPSPEMVEASMMLPADIEWVWATMIDAGLNAPRAGEHAVGDK